MKYYNKPITFPNNLKKARIKAGYTQAALAAKLGMTRQNYSRYENTLMYASPTLELLCDLSTVLRVDVNTLVGFQPNHEVILFNCLQQYMDFSKHDFILKKDNGYIVILENLPKFFILSSELESIVDECRKEAAQLTEETTLQLEMMEKKYFCCLLGIKLRACLDKFDTAPDTPPPSDDSETYQ